MTSGKITALIIAIVIVVGGGVWLLSRNTSQNSLAPITNLAPTTSTEPSISSTSSTSSIPQGTSGGYLRVSAYPSLPVCSNFTSQLEDALDFTAGPNKSEMVTKLVLTSAASSTSPVKLAYLYKASLSGGNLSGLSGTIAQTSQVSTSAGRTTITFSNSNGLFVIPKGQTVAVSLGARLQNGSLVPAAAENPALQINLASGDPVSIGQVKFGCLKK